MPIPLNRVVAFAGPYISLAAGAISSWMIARANVLGIDGLDEPNLATQIAAALSFALVAVLSWLGQSKWLAGHHVALADDAAVAAAAISSSANLAAPAHAPLAVATLIDEPPVHEDEGAQEATAELELAFAAALESVSTAQPEAAMAPMRDSEEPELADGAAPDADTIVDEALPEDFPPLSDALDDDVPDATPDELRVVMPSEAPLEGEPDEEDEL